MSCSDKDLTDTQKGDLRDQGVQAARRWWEANGSPRVDSINDFDRSSADPAPYALEKLERFIDRTGADAERCRRSFRRHFRMTVDALVLTGETCPQ